MPATMQSVTTRGFGISGGFTGDANLVITQGYGIVAAAVDGRDIALTGSRNDRMSLTGSRNDRMSLTGSRNDRVSLTGRSTS